MTHSCPECGAPTERALLLCPNCGAALRSAPTGDLHADATDLVTVFETTEVGLLPLARLALDEAGVEYAVRNVGMSDLIMGARSTRVVGETEPPFEIVVRPPDADRARDVLRDLDRAAPLPAADPAAATATPSSGTPPAPSGGTRGAASGDRVDLIDLASGALIGTLSSDAFDTLADHLERESEDDDDYYIDGATLAMLEQSGADAAAVAMLRRALGNRDGFDVQWRYRAAD